MGELIMTITYPLNELTDMATSRGLEITPELIALLDDAYQLGYGDAY